MAEPSKNFILRTDASDLGMGTFITQEVDGTPHPVGYASKKSNAAQKNNSVIEKERPAVVWVCTYYHQYLHSRQFILESGATQ